MIELSCAKSNIQITQPKKEHIRIAQYKDGKLISADYSSPDLETFINNLNIVIKRCAVESLC